MDAGHQAAAGAGLVGLAYLVDLAVALPIFGFTLVEASFLGTALGFLVAALGYAGLHYGHGHGLPALAAGYTLAGASSVVLTLLALGFGIGPFEMLGFVLYALAPVQGAWFALLWWSGGGARGEARAEGLRASAWVGVAASVLLLLSNTASGQWAFVPPTVLSLAGFLLLARSRGLRTRGADEEPAAHAPAGAAQPP